MKLVTYYSQNYAGILGAGLLWRVNMLLKESVDTEIKVSAPNSGQFLLLVLYLCHASELLNP